MKTLLAVGLCLAWSTLGHAAELELAMSCDPCPAGKVADVKATLADGNGPVKGATISMDIAQGGAAFHKRSTPTNATGNAHIQFTPKVAGKGLICAITSTGAGQSLTFEVK